MLLLESANPRGKSEQYLGSETGRDQMRGCLNKLARSPSPGDLFPEESFNSISGPVQWGGRQINNFLVTSISHF